MNDEAIIKQLYEDMYAAMITKDEGELERIHTDTYVLVHMTGMHQKKKEYIHAIMNGTLNYYSADTENLKIEVSGNEASVIGQSRVMAAVFGGGRHTWRLQLSCHARKIGDEWKIARAEASTY